MHSNQPNPKRHDRWTRTPDGISLVRAPRPPRPVWCVAKPEPVELDLACSALVIVDMQNDFLDAAGWFASVRGADVAPLSRIIPRVNALAKALRARDVPVIHLNWGLRADLANLPANVIDKGSSCGQIPGYGASIGSGDVLVAGDWGAQSVPQIDRGDADVTVHKHRLSGFQDNELDQILRRLGVRTLLYAGVNLDRCVFATLMDGCFQGYDAVLVEDATTTVSPAAVSDSILGLIRMLYGFTTTTNALIDALSLLSKPGDVS